ncbi:MaoC family dehydratase [Ferrovibrio terrae]|uniref:MaoC family dehydratase n=1 Tax=Ferrovibrio terrae TaxID=2594003 RepID=A0A516H199_9PROT|nr:MaoC family dehydratase [Ferrovibrio terrae]QDO97548.1 MaoC family dehydratase [Ferrovibrio terrae]
MATPEPDRRMGGWEGTGYDEIEVGRTFAPYPLVVDATAVAAFHDCMGDRDTPIGPGTRVPAFLLNELRAFKSNVLFPPGVLHAQEELEMYDCARLGETLVTIVRIADKYIRNDKRFIVVEQRVQAGVERRDVLLVRHILYWPC